MLSPCGEMMGDGQKAARSVKDFGRDHDICGISNQRTQQKEMRRNLVATEA